MEAVKVLDKGFVRLQDFAGGDLNVVNSARVSFGKYHEEMEEGDDKLINFLAKHRHGTPFESSWFHFHIKCPIFVAREWMRHRMSSFNEISGRYVKLEPEFYYPENSREQYGKPGAYKFKEVYEPDLHTFLIEAYEKAYECYEELLELNVAKELARAVLPVGMYTEYYYSANARSLMNFLSLRNAENAMFEIRKYAEAMEQVFEEKMPVTYRCFVENGRVSP